MDNNLFHNRGHLDHTVKTCLNIRLEQVALRIGAAVTQLSQAHVPVHTNIQIRLLSKKGFTELLLFTVT